MIYQVKRWDKEIGKPMGDVYVVGDNSQDGIDKGKAQFTLEGYALEDYHILEACECPDLRECQICKKIYDPKHLKRSQGDVYWLDQYCKAQCYTKSMMIKSDIKKS